MSKINNYMPYNLLPVPDYGCE